MATVSLNDVIKSPKIRVFRRAYIKRRSVTTGLFESTWQEITDDVKRWGTVKTRLDIDRQGKISLDGVNLILHNDGGTYNPYDDPNSLWYGYLNAQRSLVKIEAGFIYSTLSADLIWRNNYIPNQETYWDTALWDYDLWDGTESSVQFVGIISGDMALSSRNEVTLQVKPLSQIFKDYAASNLRGLNASLTASGFMTLLRDQTDGSGSYVFRPFFSDTTTYWDISTTTNVYANLSTTTAQDIAGKSCLDIIEQLAASENFAAYTDHRGTFHFVPKTQTTAVQYYFYGLGNYSSTYGHTIKEVSRYGKDFSQYYSRVSLHWINTDSWTSYQVSQTDLVVAGSNTAWALGQRTLEIENFWVPNSTTAATIVSDLYTEVSSLKNIIHFTTSFIPHLSILDRVSISYDSRGIYNFATLWGYNDFDTELTFDDSSGDAIILENKEFKFLSMEIDLDNLQCSYVAKEL